MPVVASHQTNKYRVALFGGNGSSSALDEAKAWCERYTKRKLDHIVYPPSDERDQGFQTIFPHPLDYEVYGDGVVVQPGQSIAIGSRDCPIIIGHNPGRKTLAVTHAGRAALLSPTACPECESTVVAALLHEIDPCGPDRKQVKIYITGAICGKCFQHEHPDAWRKFEPFLRRYPSAITDNYGLDLVKVIRLQLAARGVPAGNILHDGLCTREDEQLKSKRGGDTQSNYTLVTHFA